ncbi:EF-hand domain pair [Babesia duncani]|uniref:EF-hand domain pair n=1 Tax=Babesia duncani TaxID=323732 RepID=A0AAD9UNE6_9APIC|nr:EF-hand domain pair [Babesia duncani]
MLIDEKFEQMCSDVYNYYLALPFSSNEERVLAMLRATGEFWTREQVHDIIKNRKQSKQMLTFLEFRRIVKQALLNIKKNPILVDAYGARLQLTKYQINELAIAFDSICKYYNGTTEIPKDILYNILVNYNDPLPDHIARTLLDDIKVYKNNVSTRDFLQVIGRQRC